MKWKIGDRLLLMLYALIGVAASVVVGWYGVGILRGTFDAEWIPVASHTIRITIVFAVAVLLFALSVRMLLFSFKHEPKHDKSSVTVQHTDQGNGEVRISVAALDELVKQAIVGNNEGVVDIKSHIINHEDSISVRIEMSLNSDVHIPNATMLLQSAIKNFIEEFSGIAVRDVSIMVTTVIAVPPQLSLSEKTQVTQEPAVVIGFEESAAERGHAQDTENTGHAEVSQPTTEQAAAEQAPEEPAEDPYATDEPEEDDAVSDSAAGPEEPAAQEDEEDEPSEPIRTEDIGLEPNQTPESVEEEDAEDTDAKESNAPRN